VKPSGTALYGVTSFVFVYKSTSVRFVATTPLDGAHVLLK
jgi:hypothetical protein